MNVQIKSNINPLAEQKEVKKKLEVLVTRGDDLPKKEGESNTHPSYQTSIYIRYVGTHDDAPKKLSDADYTAQSFFDGYKVLCSKLHMVGVGKNGKVCNIEEPFPASYRQSTFGIKLSEDKLTDRCGQLNAWLQALVTNWDGLGKEGQLLLREFLKLDIEEVGGGGGSVKRSLVRDLLPIDTETSASLITHGESSTGSPVDDENETPTREPTPVTPVTADTSSSSSPEQSPKKVVGDKEYMSIESPQEHPSPPSPNSPVMNSPGMSRFNPLASRPISMRARQAQAEVSSPASNSASADFQSPVKSVDDEGLLSTFRKSITFGGPGDADDLDDSEFMPGDEVKSLDALSIVDSFDYAIVMPVVLENKAIGALLSKEEKEKRQEELDALLGAPQDANHVKVIVHALTKGGLETFCYLSVQKDEIICLVKSSEEKMRKFADDTDFKLELEPTETKARMKKGMKEMVQDSKTGKLTEVYVIAPVTIIHMPDVTPYLPYEHIYGKFENDYDMLSIYKRQKGRKDTVSVFSRSTRLKLVMQIMTVSTRLGGCGLEVKKLKLHGRIKAYFPLHERSSVESVKTKVTNWKRTAWKNPVNQIKEYFGEKFGLFVKFTGHYSRWLRWPALIGFIMQIILLVRILRTGNLDSPVTPFFCLFMVTWGVIMLEYWKREEVETALLWGMTDFEQKQPERPEFQGELIKSFVDGQDTLYFAPEEKRGRSIMSTFIVGSFLMLVLTTVASIYILKAALRRPLGSNASSFASILNTVQITVFNILYQGIAVWLTDMENHRTDTEYEDSMITKLFVFQFINSFASFFYIAFVAQNLERPSGENEEFRGECGDQTCMYPLMINLVIIFGTRLTLANFLDIFLPYYATKQKQKKETEGFEDAKLTPVEVDYMLCEYDDVVEGIKSYADLGIQYAFSMLFVAALPVASLFSLASNHFKIKFIVWKVLELYQRPVPAGAQDIGTWQSIFSIVTGAAVITNAGLICFTMNVLPSNYLITTRIWCFFGFQWVMFIVQAAAMYLIDDEPEEVTIQKQRMDYIVSKVIDKVRDEETTPVEDNLMIKERMGSRGSISSMVEVNKDDQEGIYDFGLCVYRPRKQKKMKTMDGADLKEVRIAEYPFFNESNETETDGLVSARV